ncbi:MAG: hypothetical protein J5911_00400 [Clostridia bacterium]|nr:hypothetical protein [Clostridia bacterium]
MAKKSGGLISRLLLGSEKSDDYARSTLPSNRWELFWDIFKGRFWKLVIINLLVVLFFLPLFALLFLHAAAVSSAGAAMPFTQGLGLGYQAIPSLAGEAEKIVVNVNLVLYALLPVVLAIAAIGVSGGAYVIRNMVWTEGIFVANDFWRGIKLNYKQTLMIALFFSLIFYISVLAISFANALIAAGVGLAWLLTVSKIISMIFIGLVTMMCLHMIPMCVTYELSFRALIKNSFLMTVALLPQNIFFFLLAFIPFIAYMISDFLMVIGIVIILFMGLSLFLLVWTDYCQWAYDKFINDRVPGAQKNKGIYEKVKGSESEALKQYRKQIAMTRSSLNSRPIKPITDDDLKLVELPASFNREDLIRLGESKQAIYDDYARYVEEHKNDPEFLPTEEEKAAEEEAKEREKRIEKAKRELRKRNKY